MYEVRFAATTSADWAEAIELIDATTNQPMDLTDATFELDVRERDEGNYGQRLTRTSADATITVPQAGVVQWRFPASDMSGLCRGETYRVGLVMTTEAGATQIFIGTLAMFDGEVS